MTDILPLALTSLDLHDLVCKFSRVMHIFTDDFMVGDVSGKEIVIKHDEVFILGLLFVEMVIQTYIHHISQNSLITAKTVLDS